MRMKKGLFIFALFVFQALPCIQLQAAVHYVVSVPKGGFIFSAPSFGSAPVGQVGIQGMQFDVVSQSGNFYSVRLPDDSMAYVPSTYSYIYKSPGQALGLGNSMRIWQTAYQFIGKPYVWGGTDPSTGFDCSGFIYYVFYSNGWKLPRRSSDQFKVGVPVHTEEMLPGDLIFFAKAPTEVSHMGMYWGSGNFIHASSKGGVKFSKLSETYYKLRFVGAKRLLSY